MPWIGRFFDGKLYTLLRNDYISSFLGLNKQPKLNCYLLLFAVFRVEIKMRLISKQSVKRECPSVSVK